MPSAAARRAAKNSPKSSPQSSPSVSPMELPESQAAPIRVVRNGELEKPQSSPSMSPMRLPESQAAPSRIPVRNGELESALSPLARSASMPAAPPALDLDRDEGVGSAPDEHSAADADERRSPSGSPSVKGSAAS